MCIATPDYPRSLYARYYAHECLNNPEFKITVTMEGICSSRDHLLLLFLYYTREFDHFTRRPPTSYIERM